jgi:hypothetical protein
MLTAVLIVELLLHFVLLQVPAAGISYQGVGRHLRVWLLQV